VTDVTDGCPPELEPAPWVYEEYRRDGFRIPARGEEIWSPRLEKIVFANGEETKPRVVLVFVGKASGHAPVIEPDSIVCHHCGAPVIQHDEPEEDDNLLLFPKEFWRPA
jgi:hypothetical protein